MSSTFALVTSLYFQRNSCRDVKINNGNKKGGGGTKESVIFDNAGGLDAHILNIKPTKCIVFKSCRTLKDYYLR